MLMIRRALGLAVLLAAGAPLAAPIARAQSVPPSAPPASINASMPTVSGTLVAKPVGGEGNIPDACRDRDALSLNAAVQQRRGLIICTEEGKLVLLVITRETGHYARYWGKIGVGRLTDGDRVRAWGVLQDNGYELDPTYAVQDVDVQEAYTDSQDFVMQSDRRLTLGVLKSDAQGPLNGIVHAVRGGKTQITLCNGQAGAWSDLTPGKTIDITFSLFNRRLNAYIHTRRVTVVSCP